MNEGKIDVYNEQINSIFYLKIAIDNRIIYTTSISVREPIGRKVPRGAKEYITELTFELSKYLYKNFSGENLTDQKVLEIKKEADFFLFGG